MFAGPALVLEQKHKWSAQKVRAWCCPASSLGRDYLEFKLLSVSLVAGNLSMGKGANTR